MYLFDNESTFIKFESLKNLTSNASYICITTDRSNKNQIKWLHYFHLIDIRPLIEGLLNLKYTLDDACLIAFYNDYKFYELYTEVWHKIVI